MAILNQVLFDYIKELKESIDWHASCDYGSNIANTKEEIYERLEEILNNHGGEKTNVYNSTNTQNSNWPTVS